MTPRVGRRLHGIGILCWLIQAAVVATLMSPGWKMYLVGISIYANVVGHWSGLSAERPTEIADGN